MWYKLHCDPRCKSFVWLAGAMAGVGAVLNEFEREFDAGGETPGHPNEKRGLRTWPHSASIPALELPRTRAP